MNYTIKEVKEHEKNALANLRLCAMKDSLEKPGRFNPDRARRRLLDTFEKSKTRKILIEGELSGFYVISRHSDHVSIAPLYIHPNFQGTGLGGEILTHLKQHSNPEKIPIRLGALKESRSNKFYQKHGFRYTHETDWDNYYEFFPL